MTLKSITLKKEAPCRQTLTYSAEAKYVDSAKVDYLIFEEICNIFTVTSSGESIILLLYTNKNEVREVHEFKRKLESLL